MAAEAHPHSQAQPHSIPCPQQLLWRSRHRHACSKIRNYRTGVVHKDTTGEGVFGMYPLTMSKLGEPAPGNQDIYTVTVFLEQTTWGLWTLFSRIFAKKLTHTKDLPVGLLSKAISIFRKLVSPRIVVRFPNPLAQAGTLSKGLLPCLIAIEWSSEWPLLVALSQLLCKLVEFQHRDRMPLCPGHFYLEMGIWQMGALAGKVLRGGAPLAEWYWRGLTVGMLLCPMSIVGEGISTIATECFKSSPSKSKQL